MISPSTIFAYVRLSREDLKGHGATEEKLNDRAAICIGLAKQHGVPLLLENIVKERESGTSIHGRPALQRILELARQGSISYLISPYQDRLLRGNKHDEQTIEDALCAHGVTLITCEGVVPFDANFDVSHGLLFSVKAAVARHFVADQVRKRKIADMERLKRNVRSRGYAPYGYKLLRPTFDVDGKQLTPQGYDMIEPEYAVLVEIFRRIRFDSLHSICRDLNNRAVPPPGIGRTKNAGDVWYRTTVRDIALNPFYAGYYAQRKQVDRDKAVRKLHPDDYILADHEGSWPHPISLSEWHEVRMLLSDRKAKYSELPEPRCGLLTGILFCPNGRPMRRNAKGCYGCICGEQGEHHTGEHTSQSMLDSWIKECLMVLTLAIPDDYWAQPEGSGRDRANLLLEINSLKRKISEAQSTVDDLMCRADWFIGLFGEENYKDTVKRKTHDLNSTKSRLMVVESEVKNVETKEALDIVKLVREHGLEWYWRLATASEQRLLVRCLIKRIDLEPIPEGRRRYRNATVKVNSVLKTSPMELPALIGRRKIF